MCVLISYSLSVWVWFGKQETNKLVLSLFLCAFQFTACYQVFRFIVVSSFARYRLTRPKQIFSYLSCYEITKGKLMAPGSSRCISKYIEFTIYVIFEFTISFRSSHKVSICLDVNVGVQLGKIYSPFCELMTDFRKWNRKELRSRNPCHFIGRAHIQRPWRLVSFTRVVVRVATRRVERYDLVKIKTTESEAEGPFCFWLRRLWPSEK